MMRTITHPAAVPPCCYPCPCHSSRGKCTTNRIFAVISIVAVIAALPKHTDAAVFVQDANLLGLPISSDDSHVSYIVTLSDDKKSPADACEALARENGGTVGHVYEEIFPGCLLTLPVAWQAHAQDEFITALSDSSKVEFVEKDQLYFEIGEDNIFDFMLDQPTLIHQHGEGNVFDPRFETQASAAPTWGLDRIDQCSLPLDGQFTKQNASGVTVFIFDTGIRGDHEEFDGIINATDTCHHSVISSEPDALTDGRGHGNTTLTFFSPNEIVSTHVAGTTCGRSYGVSSDCRLCSVKVLNAAGSGSVGGIMAAMDRVIKHCKNNTSSPCIINMSLGGNYSISFNRAVAKTVDAGVVVVVAAGNDGADACEISPASEKTAITVGSIDNRTDIKSSFSNFGPCVDVYAPGKLIRSASNSTNTSYITRSGTSMASPHVAGIVAAIRSKDPGLSPTQVVQVVADSAAQLSSGILLALVDGVSCTRAPTSTPTTFPRKASPTSTPTITTSPAFTMTPSSAPSESASPSEHLTLRPTQLPTTRKPTRTPTRRPTRKPTSKPSASPSTGQPSASPSALSSIAKPPTVSPTTSPTAPVSTPQTAGPVLSPKTLIPTPPPSTVNPTTVTPTTATPSSAPSESASPSEHLTLRPTQLPTTRKPTRTPTRRPTRKPTSKPSASPSTGQPSASPTALSSSAKPPTVSPTTSPTAPVSTPQTAGPVSSPKTLIPTPPPSTVNPTTVTPTTVNPVARPSSTPTTATPTSSPSPTTASTISADITLEIKLTLQDEDTESGRSLRRLFSEKFKLMVINAITTLVKSGLGGGQKVVAVVINSIRQDKSGNISIQSLLNLSERCDGNCHSKLENTKLVTSTRQLLDGHNKLWPFIKTEAEKMIDCDDCQKIKNAKPTVFVKILKTVVSVMAPTTAPTKRGKSFKRSKLTKSKSMKRKQPKTP